MAVKAKPTNVFNIPPVPTLRQALVAAVDSRVSEMASLLQLKSTDRLRRIAIVARDLSRTHCFFCGEVSDPLLKKTLKEVPWEKTPLCPCLAALRKVSEPPKPPKVVAPPTYEEYYPWKDNLQTIRDGALDPSTPLFSDVCVKKGCGERFTIHAGMVTRILQRDPHQYVQTRRCFSCGNAKRRPSVRSKSAAERPSKKRKTGDALTVTLQEIAAS